MTVSTAIPEPRPSAFWRLLPDFETLLARWPLPFAALVLWAWFLIGVAPPHWLRPEPPGVASLPPPDPFLFTWFGLALIFWLVGITALAEAKGWSRWRLLAIALGGVIAAIALFLMVHSPLLLHWPWLRWLSSFDPVYAAAAAFFFALAAFSIDYRGLDANRAVLRVLAACLAAAGLALGMLAVLNLAFWFFDGANGPLLATQYWRDSMPRWFPILTGLYALSLLPGREAPAPIDAPHPYGRLFIERVLLPLVLWTIIVWYPIGFISTWELFTPTGWGRQLPFLMPAAIQIVVFALGLALVTPYVATGGPLIRGFVRLLPLLAVIPIVVVASALLRDGLLVPSILYWNGPELDIVSIVICLVTLAFLVAVWRKRISPDLGRLSAVLAITWAAMSAGPWSANGMTTLVSYSFVKSALQRSGALVAGKISNPGRIDLAATDCTVSLQVPAYVQRYTCQTLVPRHLSVLARHGVLGMVGRWFPAGHEAAVPSRIDGQQRMHINLALGLVPKAAPPGQASGLPDGVRRVPTDHAGPPPPPPAPQFHFNAGPGPFVVHAPWVRSIGSIALGPFSMRPDMSELQRIPTAPQPIESGGERFHFAWRDTRLIVFQPSRNREAEFDIFARAGILASTLREPLVLEPVAGTLPVGLMITSATGTMRDGRFLSFNGRGALLLKADPPTSDAPIRP